MNSWKFNSQARYHLTCAIIKYFNISWLDIYKKIKSIDKDIITTKEGEEYQITLKKLDRADYIIYFLGYYYKLVGYSVINFDSDLQNHKAVHEEILGNSKYHTEKLNLYLEAKNFIDRYAETFAPSNNPDYIFKSCLFIKGTFIFKKL
jgi:hypothetical protein